MSSTGDKLSSGRTPSLPAHTSTAQHTCGENSGQIVPDNILRWAEELEVTEEQLARAIKQVGINAEDVIRHLTNPDVR